MENKPSVGGQAVIEGVMMRGSDCIATAVRTSTGEIVYKKTTLSSGNKSLMKKPFIRGVMMLFDSLVIGVKELTFSANQAGESDEKLTNKEAILTTIVSISLGIGLFMVLPSLIGSYFFPDNKVYSNLVEALVRLVSFVGYIYLISLSKDIKRVFEYHGAEHKSIFTYESDVELTPENAKKYTRLHPRCGTSFLFIVMFIAIIVFALVDFVMPPIETTSMKILVKLITRIIFMPVIASLAYEIQRYSSQNLDNPIVKIIAAPGMALQKITTSEPDLEQLEVAIVALKVSLGVEVSTAREVFE